MPKARKPIAETDLYKPVRDYLTANGYTVRAEVNGCDIAAVKDDDLIVIELKRNFSTSLLIQATERQSLTDSVYIAIPRPPNQRTAQWKGIQRLLKRLELGLILVSVGSRVKRAEVVFHPIPYDRRKKPPARRAVLREVEARTGDFNTGGSTRTKLMTAYRERAIHIACCLEQLGPMSPKALRKLGTGDKTYSILRNNVYGWFERIDKGIYALKPLGKSELDMCPKLAELYRAQAREAQNN